MDLLRRKRQSSGSAQSIRDGSLSSSPADTESSPASSIHEATVLPNSHRSSSGFFTTVKRSISRASSSQDSCSTTTATTPTSAAAPAPSPTPTAPSSPSRNRLHRKTNSFDDVGSRRYSSMMIGSSESSSSSSKRRLSRAYSLSLASAKAISSSSSSFIATTGVDWRAQHVEAHCAVEADPQVLRSKAAYLVVTTEYIVKMKSRADAVAAFFPQISGSCDSSMPPTAEPILVVPISLLVSVFHAESARPSFGLEFWWRNRPSTQHCCCATQAFFALPADRARMRVAIHAQMKTKTAAEAPMVPLEVEPQLMQVLAALEDRTTTKNPATTLEIFPVVRRHEDVGSGAHRAAARNRVVEGCSSWFLALGRHACYLAEVAPAGLQGGVRPGEVKCQAFGLVTLEKFRANWSVHEERFVLSFREPFKPAVTLELASRYYRQIVLTFMKADRFLKPCWPTTLQSREVFRVSGLNDPQLLIAGDNYGGLVRTLDAFLAAYHCAPVEWEINWKTAFISPEFRLLPPKSGGTYTNLQLLAVMRSLRYNGYFNSISFRGVDLSGLWGQVDTAGRTPVPYLNRSCMALSEVELGHVQFGSLLHYEIHGLAFCSESIRQFDFTNCFVEKNVLRQVPASSSAGLGFLYPILNLLELGLTKCNRLLLSGNYFRQTDIDGLVEALITQNVEIQALDLSNCGLTDLALRDVIEVLFHQQNHLQVLDVSGNSGRVQASLIAHLGETILDLRKLNVAGVLMGNIPGPLLSFDALSRFQHLEELNLSGYKVNDATLHALERFLSHERRGTAGSDCEHATPFRKLAVDNCGLNGREAARLLRALVPHTAAHLHISANPLEDGIEDLARALGTRRPPLAGGPAGLHMDMIEFRQEAHFVALMHALTANTHLTVLSLAGTAPTSHAPCGLRPAVSDALAAFFAGNTHITHLDLSGYRGRLDEGQLSRGCFADALHVLASPEHPNTTLTHLRLRNQNLHEDVGRLGAVLRHNTSLRVLDCRDNGWNLTSLQFLASCLAHNSTLLAFPFCERECNRVWARVVADLERSSFSSGSSRRRELEDQEAVLRAALQRLVVTVRGSIQRNREAVLAAAGGGGVSFAMGKDEEEEEEDQQGNNGCSWPSLELQLPGATSSRAMAANTNIHNNNNKTSGTDSGSASGRLSLIQPTGRALDTSLDADLIVTPVDDDAAQGPLAEVTRRVHTVALEDEKEEQNPYHVSRDAPLLETPPGAGSPTEEEEDTVAGSEGSSSPGGFVMGGGDGGGDNGWKDGQSPRIMTTTTMVDSMGGGSFFGGSGASRFRVGGLEAHVEE